LTAAGFEQLLTDAPASITVIDAEDFEDRSVETIADLLRDTAGVSVEKGGKLGGDNITIRDLGEDYVLMLIDGKPIEASQDAFYNGWGTGQRSGYLPPASAIERIEVIRGPRSSLYGSAASGGVINVITKNVPDKWGQCHAGLPYHRTQVYRRRPSAKARDHFESGLCAGKSMNKVRDNLRSAIGTNARHGSPNSISAFRGRRPMPSPARIIASCAIVECASIAPTRKAWGTRVLEASN
jgi:outer membrane cobalamin receptor